MSVSDAINYDIVAIEDFMEEYQQYRFEELQQPQAYANLAKDKLNQGPTIENPFRNDSERLIANYVINHKLHQGQTKDLLVLIQNINPAEVSVNTRHQLFKYIDMILEPEVFLILFCHI